ncbi:MAG TPA: MFS transporter [Ktedonobacteraceae bacterium]|nr:MFS transporter [Ktedonobacteraceae bacterium]
MVFFRSFSRLQAGGLARALLLWMGFLDEFLTGFPTIALPLLRDQLSLGYAQIGFLFTAATLAGMVIDPFVNLLSDRAAKKPWILGGLWLLALTSALMGLINNYVLLLLIFMVWYPANGAGVGLAQAVLIDGAPADGTRTMTRWTLLSSVGDFLSPLIVAAFVSAGLGWSTLSWLAAALWCAAALVLAPLRFPARGGQAEVDEDEERVSIWTTLRAAVRDPLLLRWSALTLIPTMLDEIFLGFVALYLRDVLHLDEALIALILTLQMAASFLGLFLLDLLLKRRQLATVRTLFWLSLVTLLGVVGVLAVHVLWFVVMALLVVSFCSAAWYPLAHAEAYACRPVSSGTVRTVIGLGAPLEMALPGVVGLVAANAGILAGLGMLSLAPVLMLALLPYRQRRSS